MRGQSMAGSFFEISDWRGQSKRPYLLWRGSSRKEPSMDHFGGTPPLISPAVQNFEILRVLYLAKLLILFTLARFRPKIWNFSGQKIVFLVFQNLGRFSRDFRAKMSISITTNENLILDMSYLLQIHHPSTSTNIPPTSKNLK